MKPAIALTSANQLTSDIIWAVRRGLFSAVLLMDKAKIYSAVLTADRAAQDRIEQNGQRWNVMATALYKDVLKNPSNFSPRNVFISTRGRKSDFLIVPPCLMKDFGVDIEKLRVTMFRAPGDLFKLAREKDSSFSLKIDPVATKFMKAAMALNEHEMLAVSRSFPSFRNDPNP